MVFPGSDRLVDALAVNGDPATVARRGVRPDRAPRLVRGATEPGRADNLTS